MASTDLASYKVENTGGRMRAAVWTDRVENIRRELSIESEYQQGHDSAVAVSNRLLVQKDFDTLFYLWDKYGIPYEYNFIIGEVVKDVGTNKKKIFEKIRENKKMIEKVQQCLQESSALLQSLQRRTESLESMVGNFQKEDTAYYTKR